MENAGTVVKSALNLSNLLKLTVGTVAVFAILDLVGWTDYLLYPVQTLKHKFRRAA